MNAVTPEQWQARLRDPASQQAHNTMRDGDAFCCLGHLADLIDPEAWVKTTTSLNARGYCYHWYDSGGIFAPNDLPSWLKSWQQAHASGLNDHHGWTLPQIADWVEAGMPLDVTDHTELAKDNNRENA